MTTLFETVKTTIDINTIEDAEGIQERFVQGFSALLRDKKAEAVIQTLAEDLQDQKFSRNEDFVQRVIDNLDDAALAEKPYLFLSVSPIE